MTKLHDGGHNFKIGNGIKLKSGNDLAIIATGETVQRALKACEFLEKINISYFGEDQLSLSLFDVTGKLIYSDELIFSSYTKLIDFKRLPAGFYFATISSKTSTFNTKLIKR